jgi:hypothetical protein
MRIDVFNHQLTVNYLNESFQHETTTDQTGAVDHMDNIKQMNIDWIQMKSSVLSRIDVRHIDVHVRWYMPINTSRRHWNN